IASKHSSTVDTSAPSRTVSPWRDSAASQKFRQSSGALRATKNSSVTCSTLMSECAASGEFDDTTSTLGSTKSVSSPSQSLTTSGGRTNATSEDPSASPTYGSVKSNPCMWT